MSLFNCIAEVIKDDPTKREIGERAQRMWREAADRYEAQGHPRHMAEVMAADDVKASFKKEAGDTRHVYLAALATQRRQLAEVNALQGKDALKNASTRAMQRLEMTERSLIRRYNSMIASFLKDHHTNVLGVVKDKAGMLDVVRELHGQPSGNANAKAVAEAVQAALEDMRLAFNEAGGIAGKLDNWGLPHSHNAMQIRKAEFDQWFGDIHEKVDWTRMEDHLTGKPFQKEGGPPPDIATQRKILKEIHDNIVFGKESREAVYGKMPGQPVYKRHDAKRILHFKTADDWIAYNKVYGSGDPFRALINHVHSMAKDTAAMREFGPNPNLGLDFHIQLVAERARKELSGTDAVWASGNAEWAKRMMKVYNGPNPPSGPLTAAVARFMSTTRATISSAFLDRAIISSISDLNTMRLTAQSIGLNPGNIMSTYTRTLSDMAKNGTMATDDLLRMQWIMDTLGDPGATAARFDSEFVPSELSQRLLNASMRVQGLAQHTDTMKFAVQADIWGKMAALSNHSLKDIDGPFGDFLRRSGLTENQWREFTSILQTAPNGATFANPLHWRAETSLSRAKADDIFFKIQNAIEDVTEMAVPSNSLLARGALDPASTDLSPGSLGYEAWKSTMMFKSFLMSFTVNQHRMVQARGGYLSQGGALYIANMLAGATIMGGMALQLGEIVKGNDPMPMDDPMFWARASLKGGGLGIVGDIFAAGQTSWGGGFSSYLAGPIPQVGQDAWNLTVKNAVQALAGKETKFAAELATAGKRYTPMGQTPAIGPALDRMWWDQMQLVLDPDSYKEMMRKAQSRENLFGNGAWWEAGKALPSRAPDLSTVFGQ